MTADSSALAPVPTPERHVVITVPAPLVPVERFLALPLSGDAHLWDAGAEGAFATRGAAIDIEARGAARMERVKSAAERVSAGLVMVGEPRDVRFFGGLAFDPGARRDETDEGTRAASALGEASFSIGEWTYDASGFVQRVVPERRYRSSRRELVREAESIAKALGSTAPLDFVAHSVRPPPIEDEGATFCAEVAAATDAISRGSFKKVVLARRTSIVLGRSIDPARLVAALRALEPACTRFVVERDGSVFVGATPERLVTMLSGEVRVDALAGSAPRTEGADRALLASEKDQREHAIVVDALSECLSAVVGDIAFEPTVVRTLRSVHHLLTRAYARSRPGVHVLDLVAALHPTPAVSGYPRAAARSWLREREPHSRGWYAAPVGWFDVHGSGSFGVAIRSALTRSGKAWLHAGAGIVDGSVPERELAETSAKLSSMRDALALAAGST